MKRKNRTGDAAVIARAEDALGGSEAAREWLDSPNAVLGDTPQRLMRRGETEKVAAMIARIADGCIV